MIPHAAIARLFAPRSLAVVGASMQPGAAGFQVLDNLHRFGFRGTVHLVNRHHDVIAGRACLRRVDELPDGVDAAILAVPQPGIQDAVNACIRRRLGGAVVFAAGYAETGDEGAHAQAELARSARKAGFALLGPNCLGALNFIDGIPLSFEAVPVYAAHARQRVGILAQSGAMAANLRMALLAKQVNVVFSASTGNEAALTVEDVLDWLIASDRVDLVVLFVEMLRQPRRFLAIAARARRAGKPIVLFHPGRSRRAREAARSHTGALAGDFAVMRTLVEREAVVVADSLDETFDTAALLARFPQPVAGAAAVASNSGAMRAVAIDVCQARRLTLAELGPASVRDLSAMLPDFASVDNPLDLTTAGMHTPALFADTAKVLLADPAVGSLALLLMGGSAQQQTDKARALLPLLAAAHKPVVLVLMGDESPLGDDVKARLKASGVPFLRSPERALHALARVHQRSELLREADKRAVPVPALPPAPPLPSGVLAEYKGKAWLKEAGIPVPPGALAQTLDAALQIAQQIGWPVALKAQADALTHKSDVGGVALSLADADALRKAWALIHKTLARRCPEIVPDGILVEKMAAPGLELVVGARRDPAWGVVLMAGLGGVWVEILGDVRLMAPDLTQAQIERELHRLKGAALLDGVRGGAAVDVTAAVKAVRRLGDLMLAHAELAEIEINPLLVGPSGQGALALDVVLIAGARA